MNIDEIYRIEDRLVNQGFETAQVRSALSRSNGNEQRALALLKSEKAAAAKVKNVEELFEIEERLVQMGFAREIVKEVLKTVKGDEQAALDSLLSDHSAVATSSSSSSSSSSTSAAAGSKTAAILRRPSGAPKPVDINTFKFKCDFCANMYETQYHMEKHQKLRHTSEFKAKQQQQQQLSPRQSAAAVPPAKPLKPTAPSAPMLTGAIPSSTPPPKAARRPTATNNNNASPSTAAAAVAPVPVAIAAPAPPPPFNPASDKRVAPTDYAPMVVNNNNNNNGGSIKLPRPVYAATEQKLNEMATSNDPTSRALPPIDPSQLARANSAGDGIAIPPTNALRAPVLASRGVSGALPIANNNNNNNNNNNTNVLSSQQLDPSRSYDTVPFEQATRNALAKNNNQYRELQLDKQATYVALPPEKQMSYVQLPAERQLPQLQQQSSGTVYEDFTKMMGQVNSNNNNNSDYAALVIQHLGTEYVNL